MTCLRSDKRKIIKGKGGVLYICQNVSAVCSVPLIIFSIFEENVSTKELKFPTCQGLSFNAGSYYRCRGALDFLLCLPVVGLKYFFVLKRLG